MIVDTTNRLYHLVSHSFRDLAYARLCFQHNRHFQFA